MKNIRIISFYGHIERNMFSSPVKSGRGVHKINKHPAISMWYNKEFFRGRIN